QFVRQRVEEVVLEAAGVERIVVEARGIERSGGSAGELLRERDAPRVGHTPRRRADGERAEHGSARRYDRRRGELEPALTEAWIMNVENGPLARSQRLRQR